jgi:hypothetical protein
VIDLGTLAPGQTGLREVVVRNASRDAVEVARIDSSCPCLRVEPSWFRIDAGSSRPLAVQFTPDDDGFRGRLAVILKGRGPRDDVLLTFRAEGTLGPTPTSGPEGGQR